MKIRNQTHRLITLGLSVVLFYSLDNILRAAEEVPMSTRVRQAQIFSQSLVWVGKGEPTARESGDLWEAIETLRTKGKGDGLPALEMFISTHPNGSWTPSLEANLGKYYREHGLYTLALRHWESAWQATKEFKEGDGKKIADFSLAFWTRLLASLGRVDSLDAIYEDTSGRLLDQGPLQQIFIGTREGYRVMKSDPGRSYRCGTFALSAVAGVLKLTNELTRTVLQTPSPATGFTLNRLMEFSDKAGLGLQAVKRQRGQTLIVPSVVHWKQNHYAAIIAQKGDQYEVTDPTFGRVQWLDANSINAEASGYFMIPTNRVSPDFAAVGNVEATGVYGKGNPDLINDGDDQPPCPRPGPGNDGEDGGCPDCAGMPVWRVSEPYINLWVDDEPLGYQPARGARISFGLSFKQRDTTIFDANIFSVGKSWNGPWLSYVDDGGSSTATMRVAGGGSRTYIPDGTNVEYLSTTRLLRLTNGSGDLTGFKLLYLSGAVDVYNFIVTSMLDPARVYLTANVDASGHTNRFDYTNNAGVVRLLDIVDAQGFTNIINYVTANATSTNLISQVTDAYGRTTTLQYDADGHMTNIVDVAGLTNTFLYDSNGWISNLLTPYGTTQFSFYGGFTNTMRGGGVDRAITITEPNDSKQQYVYMEENGYIPIQYADSPNHSYGQSMLNEPASSIQNTYIAIQERNTWHWNRQQYPLLSTTNLNARTAADFGIGTQKQWLHGPIYGDGPPYNLSGTLNMKRISRPSLSDANEGQRFWYGYLFDGSGYYTQTGDGYHWSNSFVQPIVTATSMGGDNTPVRYIWRQFNQYGLVTNELSNYGVMTNVDTDNTRSNIYIYDANNIDLIMKIGPRNTIEFSNVFNSNHQITTNYDALSQPTYYTYDPTTAQLTSIKYPSGLTTTNQYDSSGFLTNTIDIEIGRTNSFTYTNGLIYTHTDERGLTVTNYYDNLQRLVGQSFPDGTTTSNLYYRLDGTSFPSSSGGTNLLDLTGTKDRMGNWTYFAYNSLRQKIAETNALGNVTTYDYCDCGNLSSITDALTNTTSFTYDLDSRLTSTTYPDGYYVTNIYNRWGQVVQQSDSAGRAVTNNYMIQGMIASSSNSLGRALVVLYDLDDRATNTTDANGVTITNSYDDLNRLLVRGYPDAGTEKFGYTTSGLVAYTNQLDKVTRYEYDAAGRKITETNANLEVTRFTYDSAGDLLTLSDGKTQVTTWNYDVYGLMTNKVDNSSAEIMRFKYDADQRMTNRFSLAKNNTYYSYDQVGNLTNVAYPVNHAISLAYDPLNRLTNMIDATGTTKYGYDVASQLLSEDGPWNDDAVSYTYTNRMRNSLSLQEQNADAWLQTYAYDSAGRLTNTTSAAGSFTYSYDLIRKLLVNKLLLPNTAYITNDYDTNARVLDTRLRNSGNTNLNVHSYAYNVGNQRTNQTFLKGNYQNYLYDGIGQLTNIVGKDDAGGATNRLQEQLTYGYDAAHNLNARTNNALVQTFNVNGLNELTTITRSGTFSVAGTTSSNATSVTVNTIPATRYADYTFAKDGFSLSDGNNTFTAVASDALGRSDTSAVTVNLPATATYMYDSNGNLTSDGTRGFDYDDENQLIRVTVTNTWKTEFVYDGKMRMRIRKDYAFAGSYVLTNEVRYIYDGNTVIQERTSMNFPVTSYTRGIDKSGSFQGAGGIGGLLARSDHAHVSPAHSYYHADGNGNITAMINSQQFIAARYEYDPYGNVLSQSGPLASANTYQFSSKEYMKNAGLVYYLYRFYEPQLQRWVNQDPSGERGGINLNTFVQNDPIGFIDLLGLDCKDSLTLEFVPKTELGGALSRWKTEPSGTVYADNVDSAMQTIGSRFGKFDPDGKCCNGHCIQTLTISAHGGPGAIEFTPGKVQFGTAFFKYDEYANSSIPSSFRQGTQNDVKDYLKELALLELLASKMCHNGTVIFVVCDLGEGDPGQQMKNKLNNIFPTGTKMTLPQTPVGFVNRTPYIVAPGADGKKGSIATPVKPLTINK